MSADEHKQGRRIEDYPLYGQTGVKGDSMNNFSYLVKEARERCAGPKARDGVGARDCMENMVDDATTLDITDKYLEFMGHAGNDPSLTRKIGRMGFDIDEEIAKSKKHIAEVSR